MTDDEIWSLGRECGLMTKQPGTQAFDAAMFAFARRLIDLAKGNSEEAKEPNEGVQGIDNVGFDHT